MRITIKDDSVLLGNDHVIKMECFTNLYEGFVAYRTGKDTAEIEKRGAALLKSGLGDSQCINKFVKSVIIWGEENRGIIYNMVYPPENTSEDNAKIEAEITEIVTDTAICLQNDDLKSAINRIKDVHGFCISYGSKVLRMLSPEKAGAYDSILRAKFPSYRGIEGYVEFCGDCQRVAEVLKKHGVKSHRKDDEWFAADAEAVIYHYIRPIHRAENKTKNAQ